MLCGLEQWAGPWSFLPWLRLVLAGLCPASAAGSCRESAGLPHLVGSLAVVLVELPAVGLAAVAGPAIGRRPAAEEECVVVVTCRVLASVLAVGTSLVGSGTSDSLARMGVADTPEA